MIFRHLAQVRLKLREGRANRFLYGTATSQDVNIFSTIGGLLTKPGQNVTFMLFQAENQPLFQQLRAFRKNPGRLLYLHDLRPGRVELLFINTFAKEYYLFYICFDTYTLI